ncbi:MAG: hypothetical protein IT376_05815 [Polyangiaceae bacterium]|nr:hypothetical protein [Polyangiaceae bacterium]
MPAADLATFEDRFSRAARGVRARLLLRRMTAGAAVGLVAGAAAAGALWSIRAGELRPWSAALGLLGALAGAAVALRRRWTDEEVALFLDARLGAGEAIVTALEARRSEADRGGPRGTILRAAAEALSRADRRALRVRWLERWYGAGALAAAGVAWASLAPLPPEPPAPPAPPGAEIVRLPGLLGLEKIEALETLGGRDAAQEERLRGLAAEARKLRADLARGVERRDAQARVARLRDDLAAERLRLGDRANRPGREAAVGKLAERQLSGAAKALGDGDLAEFDREMQKLANQQEAESRRAAREALEEAARAAREKGAEALARALEAQRELFAKREASAQALRELARELDGKLSDEARRDLEEFGRSGDPEAQRRLAESLGKALEGLDADERRRLAERLEQRMEGSGGSGASPMTREQLEELARRLRTPEGRAELEEQLRELARPEASPDAQRERGLGEAERGGAEAERGLGGVPMPGGGTSGGGEEPGRGGSERGSPGAGPSPSGGDPSAPGGPGSRKDHGRGAHGGETPRVDGREVRSKASGRLGGGAPLHGATTGRAPARAGETAEQAGSGALGEVGPGEVEGMDRSEVPEEYREHVGRYFQP